MRAGIKHRYFSLNVVGEIGLSPSTRRTKVLGAVSHYNVLRVRVQIYEFCTTLRRDERGAYHLFGGGVTNKTQEMLQIHLK